MITAATVIETRTASGAAPLTGIRKASRGTATSASPNPKTERISVATNTTSQDVHGGAVQWVLQGLDKYKIAEKRVLTLALYWRTDRDSNW